MNNVQDTINCGNHVSKCLPLGVFSYILKLYNDENLAASYTLWISQLFLIVRRTSGWLNGQLFSRSVIFYDFCPIVGLPRWFSEQSSNLTKLCM